MVDQLTSCRKCQSPLCYEQHKESVISWSCLQCGFTTNTLLMANTDTVLSYESMLPSLYRDIKYVDSDGFVWYPNTMIKDGVGIIFADIVQGEPVENWKWAVAKHVPVEESEKEKFKKSDGTYHKYKTDMKHVLHFDQNYYSRALEILGLI